jgi:hypothetical protein
LDHAARFPLGPVMLAGIVTLLSACASRSPVNAMNAAPYPPPACDTQAFERAKRLKLSATTSKDADAFSRSIGVNRALTRVGHVHDVDSGWSTVLVMVQSEGALSLSAHLRDLKLPARTEIWWCSADGRERHGPYREAAGGDLWTPVIRADRGLLQVWMPTASYRSFEGELADVQGGLR